MLILIDEQLDRRLKPLFLPEHEALTVEEAGWKGTKNGKLLRLAQDLSTGSLLYFSCVQFPFCPYVCLRT